MIILIDTNVILDVLLKRETFYISGVNILKLAERGELKAYLTATSITDIFYILKKYVGDKTAVTLIKKLLQIVGMVSVTSSDIFKAFDMGCADFEDAVQMQCGKKLKADFIVTRDKKGFKDSTVKIISPEKLVEKFSKT